MYPSVNNNNQGVFNILVKTLSEKKKNPIQPPTLEEMISKIGEEHNLSWSDIEAEANRISQGCIVSNKTTK